MQFITAYTKPIRRIFSLFLILTVALAPSVKALTITGAWYGLENGRNVDVAPAMREKLSQDGYLKLSSDMLGQLRNRQAYLAEIGQVRSPDFRDPAVDQHKITAYQLRTPRNIVFNFRHPDGVTSHLVRLQAMPSPDPLTPELTQDELRAKNLPADFPTMYAPEQIEVVNTFYYGPSGHGPALTERVRQNVKQYGFLYMPNPKQITQDTGTDGQLFGIHLRMPHANNRSEIIDVYVHLVDNEPFMFYPLGDLSFSLQPAQTQAPVASAEEDSQTAVVSEHPVGEELRQEEVGSTLPGIGSAPLPDDVSGNLRFLAGWFGVEQGQAKPIPGQKLINRETSILGITNPNLSQYFGFGPTSNPNEILAYALQANDIILNFRLPNGFTTNLVRLEGQTTSRPFTPTADPTTKTLPSGFPAMYAPAPIQILGAYHAGNNVTDQIINNVQQHGFIFMPQSIKATLSDPEDRKILVVDLRMASHTDPTQNLDVRIYAHDDKPFIFYPFSDHTTLPASGTPKTFFSGNFSIEAAYHRDDYNYHQGIEYDFSDHPWFNQPARYGEMAGHSDVAPPPNPGHSILYSIRDILSHRGFLEFPVNLQGSPVSRFSNTLISCHLRTTNGIDLHLKLPADITSHLVRLEAQQAQGPFVADVDPATIRYLPAGLQTAITAPAAMQIINAWHGTPQNNTDVTAQIRSNLQQNGFLFAPQSFKQIVGDSDQTQKLVKITFRMQAQDRSQQTFDYTAYFYDDRPFMFCPISSTIGGFITERPQNQQVVQQEVVQQATPDFTTPGRGGISFDVERRTNNPANIQLIFSTQPQGQGDSLTVTLNHDGIIQTDHQYPSAQLSRDTQQHRKDGLFPAQNQTGNYVVTVDGGGTRYTIKNGVNMFRYQLPWDRSNVGQSQGFPVQYVTLNVSSNTDLTFKQNPIKAATPENLPAATRSFAQPGKGGISFQTAWPFSLKLASTEKDAREIYPTNSKEACILHVREDRIKTRLDDFRADTYDPYQHDLFAPNNSEVRNFFIKFDYPHAIIYSQKGDGSWTLHKTFVDAVDPSGDGQFMIRLNGNWQPSPAQPSLQNKLHYVDVEPNLMQTLKVYQTVEELERAMPKIAKVDEALYTAIINDDLWDVKASLAAGADISKSPSRFQAPIIDAIVVAVMKKYRNQPPSTKIIKELLNRGASLDVTYQGSPILSLCVQAGLPLIVLEELIKNDTANLNQTDSYNATFLHKLLTFKDRHYPEKDRHEIEAIGSLYQALRAKRIDVNVSDDRGYTPLHMAFEKGDRNAFDFLMSKDARTDIRNASGYTVRELYGKEQVNSRPERRVFIEHISRYLR
ncbi:MAG: hypothetical protein H6679_00270 [Epsilonproteobacteria bacterium]|nr:hypothetical protein [Campylobacterota bacterium]